MMDPTLEIPARIRALPRDARGYPVPWFVAFVEGSPDFRVIAPNKREDAVRRRLCWVCGQPLGRTVAYVVGPMCIVNRTSAEPPSHCECAAFSVRACPFLTLPKAQRREHNLPAGTSIDGTMIPRNPGVIVVWETRRDCELFRDGRGGFLFHLPEASALSFWREGRPATRDEVAESIDSGLPILQELASKDGPAAVLELAAAVERVGVEVRRWVKP